MAKCFLLKYFFLFFYSIATEARSEKVQPFCYLKCLQERDYFDLLYTTLAEFPGLFITMIIIEILGRKKTMAIEFMVFSIFVFLLNLCVGRYKWSFIILLNMQYRPFVIIRNHSVNVHLKLNLVLNPKTFFRITVKIMISTRYHFQMKVREPSDVWTFMNVCVRS